MFDHVSSVRDHTKSSHMPRSEHRGALRIASHVILTKAALNREPTAILAATQRHFMEMFLLAMLGPQKQFVP